LTSNKQSDKLHLMKIPNNVRRLKSNEIIRDGDYFKHKIDSGREGKMNGDACSNFNTPKQYHNWIFYRVRTRLLKSKGMQGTTNPINRGAVFNPATSLWEPKQFQHKQNTEPKKPKKLTVTFVYPDSVSGGIVERFVEVISIDSKYITGLEKQWENGKTYKWQFKKFLRSKIYHGGIIHIESYNN